MQLVRTFHAVGQGAFYTERFNDGYNNLYNVVYDCGTSNSQNYLTSAINNEFAEGTNIDYLFVSHFHKDHISGIDTLRTHCRINQIIIPVVSPEMIAEAVLYNYIENKNAHGSDDAFDKIMDIIKYCLDYGISVAQLNEQGELLNHIDPIVLSFQTTTSLVDKWIYIPYNPQHIPLSNILNELSDRDCTALVQAIQIHDFVAIGREIKQMNLQDLKDAYSAAFGNHHVYVMPVYSGPYSIEKQIDEKICLFTGDYDASDAQKVWNLKDPISNRWDTIGTLQVPHHGSRDNSCIDLYDNLSRVSVISSVGSSRYHHPHWETIQYICGRGKTQLQLVTNNQNLPYTKTFVL